MSYAVGPLAVPAAGSVQLPVPSESPIRLVAVVIDNATPYVLTVNLAGSARFVAPFTSDLLPLPDSISQSVTIQASRAPGGPASVTQSYITATYYDTTEDTPDGYPASLASQLIQAVLAGGHVDTVDTVTTVTNPVDATLSGPVVVDHVTGDVLGNLLGSAASVTGNVGGKVVNNAATAASGLFGNGSDGAVTLASNTTLLRDAQYTSLTINAGVILNTAGYRARATIQIALGNASLVHNNGGNGANGGNAGTAGATGSMLGGGLGGLGGNGGGGGGASPASPSLGGNGGNAGQNATGGGPAGGLGGKGASGGPLNVAAPLGQVASVPGLTGGGGGGGGSGGGGTFGNGGGGGGGGGLVSLAAPVITGTAHIGADGGNGGNATSGGSAANGNGGGGGGGGLVYILTNRGNLSVNLSLTAAGGSAGAGSGTGTGGTAGQAGLVIVTEAPS